MATPNQYKSKELNLYSQDGLKRLHVKEDLAGNYQFEYTDDLTGGSHPVIVKNQHLILEDGSQPALLTVLADIKQSVIDEATTRADADTLIRTDVNTLFGQEAKTRALTDAQLATDISTLDSQLNNATGSCNLGAVTATSITDSGDLTVQGGTMLNGGLTTNGITSDQASITVSKSIDMNTNQITGASKITATEVDVGVNGIFRCINGKFYGDLLFQENASLFDSNLIRNAQIETNVIRKNQLLGNADIRIESSLDFVNTNSILNGALVQTTELQVDTLKSVNPSIADISVMNNLNIQQKNIADVQQLTVKQIRKSTAGMMFNDLMVYDGIDMNNQKIINCNDLRMTGGINTAGNSINLNGGQLVNVAGINIVGDGKIIGLGDIETQTINGLSIPYYRTGTQDISFHTTANNGTVATVTAHFERIGRSVTMSIPEINLNIGNSSYPSIKSQGTTPFPIWAMPADFGGARPQFTFPAIVRRGQNKAIARIVFTPDVIVGPPGDYGTIDITRDDNNTLWGNNSNNVGTDGITTLTYECLPQI